MKVRSLKDVETYIYTTLILPLKNLNLPELQYDSPIRDGVDSLWQFRLERTPTMGSDFRRNFQRDRAENNREWWFVLYRGGEKTVVGEYNRRSHWVKLWDEPFKESGAMLVFGKLLEAVETNTPFTKVIVEHTHPPRYSRGETQDIGEELGMAQERDATRGLGVRPSLIYGFEEDPETVDEEREMPF